jgi:hypothetical protein
MMLKSRHVRWRTPVQINRWMVIDVAHQLPHVEQRKLGTGIPLRDQGLERRLVFVHVVHRGDVLVHHVRDLCLVGRHGGPVVVRAGAVDGVAGVQRGEVERGNIQEDEEAAAGGVEGVEGREDAGRVVGQDFAGDLRVGEEGVDADVVGAWEKEVIRRSLRNWEGGGGRGERRWETISCVPIHMLYTASVPVRAGVKYASVVPFRSELLSARKAGISYSRTDGKFACMTDRVLHQYSDSGTLLALKHHTWRNEV